MSFQLSNLPDRNPRRNRLGVSAFLLGVSLVLAGVSAMPALAQDADTIGVTYQSGDEGIKNIEAPIQGLGTPNPFAIVTVEDAAYSAQGNDFASLDDGSAFVVTPIIDPELQLFYNLTNNTLTPLTSLTFTLQQTQANDFYFQFPTAFEPRAGGIFNFSFSDGITGFSDRFRSLTFTANSSRPQGLAPGASQEFSFAMIVPGTAGQPLGVQLRPNGGQELQFNIPGAPEPGSASLLLLAGAVCLPVAATKIRRRLRRNRNTD